MRLQIKNIEIELMYSSDTGYLTGVKDVATGKYLMLEVAQVGSGYIIHKDKEIPDFTGSLKVCDVRCVRIVDLNVYIPTHLFVDGNQ